LISTPAWAPRPAAVVIPESLLTPEALSAQVAALLSNPKGAARLAAAATAAGKPDAAEALADLAESLVRPAS
jgi:UDP-N-acetylglucosamine--N-acetylmuramyl-(pentapeptide) pyrophosphoryl-undecaprenol N-acetylglucosamine transferase